MQRREFASKLAPGVLVVFRDYGGEVNHLYAQSDDLFDFL
jgi:hypothetical protein